MAKSTDSQEAAPKRKRGRGANPDQTKAELIDAAIASLLAEGFGGTTARSIAALADCNQAAIYYHFGGINELLLAALEVSSRKRLDRYKAELHDGQSIQEILQVIQRLYAEDHESGHLGVLTELVGGITASPELRDGIEVATAPWLEFVEQRIADASQTVAFGSLLPAADLADLMFSLVIGVELRNRVDGKADRADRLFRLAQLAAGLAQSSSEP